MMGVMNDWERVDADASVPHRGPAPGRSADPPPALRLRRNRNPIIGAFDLGGRVFRRRVRDVVLGATAILVPAVVLNLWVTIVATDRVDPNADTTGLFADASAGNEDIGVFVAVVFVGVATALVGHFCAQLLLGERFQQPIGAGAALKTTLRRSPAVFVAWLLTHWWFVALAGLVATASSDQIGPLLFFSVVVMWPSSAATLLVVPVMVGEGLGPFRAAIRSWRLARRRFGTCLGFVFLSTVLATLFGLGITTMIPLLDQFGFLQFGDATGTIVAVAAQLAVLFVVPLVAMATAQFYVELRISAEGLDMSLDAAAAFPDTATASAGDR